MTTARSWGVDHDSSSSVFLDTVAPTTRNCSDAAAAAAAWNAHVQSQQYSAHLVNRAVTPIWYAVGIVGNVLSALVWLQRRMRQNNSSAVYLATLAVNDTLFLLLHILLELHMAWDVHALDYPVVCETFSFVYLVPQYLAPTLVLGFTVERFIAVCYPYQKIRFCTTSRAVKVVIGMIVGCSLLGSIQPYLWAFNPTENKCLLRPHAEALWEVWSWATEMIVFLVVPLVILIVNVLVMREVWRMSSAGPAAGSTAAKSTRGSTTPGSTAVKSTRGSSTPSVLRHASLHSETSTSKNATTNVMLLTVSFYVIFTTLPATLVYVLANVFPEVNRTFQGGCADAATTTQLTPSDGLEDPEVVTLQRYVVYVTVRNVVNEICLSHYACNFFFYVVTGREFRAALRRLFGGSVAEINRGPANGTPWCAQTVLERTHAGNEQRTLLAKV